MPVADSVGGKAMIATAYEGAPIAIDHGGQARGLMPHRYVRKSAKWLMGLRFTQRDEAGFWERRGYRMRGDPRHEQRFSRD